MRTDKKKKKIRRHVKAPIMALAIPSKRFQQDESNATKKVTNNDGNVAHSIVKSMYILWAASVTHTSHNWWLFLMTINLSCRDFFNDINDVIIFSVPLQFLLFLFFSLIPSSHCNLCNSFYKFFGMSIFLITIGSNDMFFNCNMYRSCYFFLCVILPVFL
jgi:hypothetical protein